jgi:thioredoxin-related protein
MDIHMHKIILTLFFVIIAFNSSLFARNIDIDSIVKNSIGKNKYLFVFLHRTDCGYCESMQTFTLDDDPVKELIKKDFVFLHINISEDDVVKYKNFTGNGRNFAKFVGYNIYPSSLFLNSANEIIYATPGYQDKEQFLVTLKYVDSGAYKKMDFPVFKKKMDVSKKH